MSNLTTTLAAIRTQAERDIEIAAKAPPPVACLDFDLIDRLTLAFEKTNTPAQERTLDILLLAKFGDTTRTALPASADTVLRLTKVIELLDYACCMLCEDGLEAEYADVRVQALAALEGERQ